MIRNKYVVLVVLKKDTRWVVGKRRPRDETGRTGMTGVWHKFASPVSSVVDLCYSCKTTVVSLLWVSLNPEAQRLLAIPLFLLRPLPLSGAQGIPLVEVSTYVFS